MNLTIGILLGIVAMIGGIEITVFQSLCANAH